MILNIENKKVFASNAGRVMKGYFKDKDATEKAMTGGWFHSGDLAVAYPDGYIKIQDDQRTSLYQVAKIYLQLKLKIHFQNIHLYLSQQLLLSQTKNGEKCHVPLLKKLKIRM